MYGKTTAKRLQNLDFITLELELANLEVGA